MSTKTLTYRGVKYERTTTPTLNSIHSVWVSRDENKKEREKFQSKLDRERLK